MSDNLNKVGDYRGEYNTLLNISLPNLPIYISSGLQKHILSRHRNCMKYLGKIAEIIKEPDYVGNNPKEPNSIELVKVYADNVQIGIKLDVSNNYLYVATLFDVKQGKIDRRLNSGRLKPTKENETLLTKPQK